MKIATSACQCQIIRFLAIQFSFVHLHGYRAKKDRMWGSLSISWYCQEDIHIAAISPYSIPEVKGQLAVYKERACILLSSFDSEALEDTAFLIRTSLTKRFYIPLSFFAFQFR